MAFAAIKMMLLLLVVFFLAVAKTDETTSSSRLTTTFSTSTMTNTTSSRITITLSTSTMTNTTSSASPTSTSYGGYSLDCGPDPPSVCAMCYCNYEGVVTCHGNPSNYCLCRCDPN